MKKNEIGSKNNSERKKQIWKTVKIGNSEFFERFSGDTPKKGNKDYWDGEIKWLSNSEVSEEHVDLISDTDQKITKEGLNSCTAKIVPKNSVILSCTASIGKVAINTNDIATNQQFNSFKIKKGFNPYFLANQLLFRGPELEAMGGSTTHNHLAVYVLEKLDLDKPPLPEQRKIASVLYNVDQAIQKTEEIIEQTQKVKKGLMQDLFTEGYYEHEETKMTPVGEVPADWNLKNISEIGKIINGSTFPEEEQGESEGVPFIKVSDTNKTDKYASHAENFITRNRADEINVRILPENSVILPKRGAAILTNKRRLLPQDSAIDNNQIGVYAEEINNTYLYHYLCTVDMERYAQKGAVASLNKSTLAKIKVPVPEKDEQKKIANSLDSLDKKISQLKEEKEQLQRLKKGLMQDLLTGEVRTKDRDIEVVDAVKEVEG